MNASLLLIDSVDFLFPLFSFSVEFFRLDLKDVFLSEVKRQPVGELLVSEGVSDSVLHEGSHREQVLSGRYHSDLSGSWKPVDRYADT